jgi:ABC-type glycerol-3-phosphate transport system substrate-binding protein
MSIRAGSGSPSAAGAGILRADGRAYGATRAVATDNVGRLDLSLYIIDDMINGTTLMSLDWGDTGPASVSEQSVVKNKLGFALTPGVTEYYDWVNKTWVTMPEGEIHQTPTHAYNGWSYYITSQSQNPDAAWEWIKFHGSPAVSAISGWTTAR